MSGSTPGFAVRLATVADRSALHDLSITDVRRPARARRDGFPGWWEVEAQSILRDARPPRDAVLLGFVGLELAAACRWTTRGDRGHIDAVGVSPEHRGRRLGVTMVRHAVQQVRSSGEGSPPSSVRVTARAHQSNAPGLSTLRSAGMEALDSEDTAPYITYYRLA